MGLVYVYSLARLRQVLSAALLKMVYIHYAGPSSSVWMTCSWCWQVHTSCKVLDSR
jgi:hypothetical protein